MTKLRESETFVEIAGYLYKDPGRARAALHVGDVNKVLHPDEAEEITRMKKVRVTMNVSEDRSVQKNKVYEKDIEMIQEVIGDPSGKSGKGTVYDEGISNPGASVQEPKSLDGLQVLKNFVDKIAENQTALWVCFVGIALVAAVALGLSIAG